MRILSKRQLKELVLYTPQHVARLERAGLVDRAQDRRWSNVAAHIAQQYEQQYEGLVTVAPVNERLGRFADSLDDPFADETVWRALRMSERSGRPLGSSAWLDDLEIKTGRTLKARKRGPKPRPKKISAFSKLAP